MTQVAPSLLSADFARLGEAVGLVDSSEATLIHIDMMDGVFVPNITIGFPVIKALAKVARKPLDVHCMIVDPGRYVERLAESGASIMNVHYEACTHLHRTVTAIREAGMSPAVTLNPATPVELLEDILQDVDMVLLMSVNPGFGGQKFIENTLAKIGRLRRMIERTGRDIKIEVDGGVNLSTGRRLVDAGADILVAGNFVFSATDPLEAIASLARL